MYNVLSTMSNTGIYVILRIYIQKEFLCTCFVSYSFERSFPRTEGFDVTSVLASPVTPPMGAFEEELTEC